MPDETDRRRRGQESYLTGVVLSRARWQSTRQDQDHDHCAFCQKLIRDVDVDVDDDDEDDDDEADVGWTTADEYHWICDDCFADFKDEFEWRVADHPDSRRRA